MLKKLFRELVMRNRESLPEGNYFLTSFIQLFMPSIALIVILMVVIYGAMIPLIRNIYIEQKKEQCRNLVVIVTKGLTEYNSKARSGEVDLRRAKTLASDIIREFKFGNNGSDYFWVIDMELRLVVHPLMPEFEGIDSDTIPASGGGKLSEVFRKIRDTAAPHGEGFSDYYLSSPASPGVSVKKIFYAAEFAPWGWIIGTSVSLDQINEGVKEWKGKSVKIAFLMSGIAVLFSFLLSLRAVKHHRREFEALTKVSHSEKQFRAIFNMSPVSICITLMSDGTFVAANPAFCGVTGYPETELLGRTPLDLGIIQTAEELELINESLRTDREIANRELKIRSRGGEEQLVVFSSKVIKLEQFNAPCLLTMIVDISENYRLTTANDELKEMIRKRTSDLIKMDLELKEKSERIEQVEKQLLLAANVFENVSESVVITDREGNILNVNQAFTLINGYTSKEAKGENPRILKSERHNREFYDEMWKTILRDHFWSGEIWNRRKNGEAYPALLSITAVTDREGEITHYIAVTRDITELHRSRDELNYRVMHDVLTGLPNRDLFTDRLSVAFPKAEKAGGNVTVIMIGLDRLAGINKALGFPAGDSFLQETGRRLKEYFKGTGSVARFGGDEFVGMVSFDDDLIHAVRVADELIELFRAPFSFGEETFYLSASIGVATFPQDGREPDELIRNASIAMERAKSEGKNRYSLFAEKMDDRMLRRLRLETDIRKGIDAGEFTLYYQPKIDLETGQVHGMESLMRWFPAEGDPVSPGEFIPVAEETGEISRLGEMAVHTACAMNVRLCEAGHRLKVAVNVSPKQFFDEEFIPMVRHALDTTGLDPVLLELEITESTVMRDIGASVSIMRSLGELGVSFSLDDFGTGYSSLSHIKNLPLSGVKFDSSFVRDVVENSETRAIIKALASMCRELMLELTVEGVETEEQLNAIRKIAPGAMIQGYYFSRPLNTDSFEKYLQESGKNETVID